MTPKKRFAARIVSGFTAALFLGNDFYNKAIKKGKTKQEAQKEQHLKQKQEIKENLCEGIAQFAIFAAFPRFTNSSPAQAAITMTGIGFVSRIISRLSSKMPIFRIDVPKQLIHKYPSLEEYQKHIQNGKKTKDIAQNSAVIDENKIKDNKKHILTLKNILLFCATSIIGGYVLRGAGKIKIKGAQGKEKEISKIIKDFSANLREKIFGKDTETIVADKKTLEKLSKTVFAKNGIKKLNQKISDIIQTSPSDKIIIGEDYKKVNFFGAQVKKKDLINLITAPVSFIKTVISYPYQIIALRLEEAIKKGIMKKDGIKITQETSEDYKFEKLYKYYKELKKHPSVDDIKTRFDFAINSGKIEKNSHAKADPYNIKNIYKKFVEFEKKYSGDDEKLQQEFIKYLEKMILLSNNNISSSKGNNSKIAVLAQVSGTITGMWFNMNDEFNSSVRNGSTKEEAQKDARLRGVNKFFRMTVQAVIAGSLNNLFSKQYNNSIAKAAAVVGVSTVLTDSASRVLSGMPNQKMNKKNSNNIKKNAKKA